VSRGCILFADNNPHFLKTRAEFLERDGYQVRQAHSVEEAEAVLRDEWVHLAVLDIRLTDDDDPLDVSGLKLAQLEAYRSVPKIILTRFPSYEYVREVMSPVPTGLPPAVDFLDKREGAEKMLQTVAKAFAKHVLIHWNLVIQPNEQNTVTFPQLANIIEPGIEGERLVNRAGELEDLFRRLCYEATQIKIDRLLWQREGRVALAVFAFAEGRAPESMIVVCGQTARMTNEARRYREFSPKAVGELGTALSAKAETMRFAANAFTLADAGLENTLSLAELYRTGSEKLFHSALETLLQKTLAAWYQEKRIPAGLKSLGQAYRERLRLAEEHLPPAAFDERVRTIIDQAPTLGTGIERDAGRLTVRFNGQSFSYPDPAQALHRTFANEHPVLLLQTSGTLSGDNILTGNNGRTWLTDFAEAGLAPLLWNFVALEALIRFDWSDTQKLQWLHDMERRLVDGDFVKLDMRDLESPLRKQMRAIQAIRRLALQMAGGDPMQYHLGMLFHAASRLADFNPGFRLLPNELARLTHALIAAAIICNRITQGAQPADWSAAPDVAGIRIDKANYAVWVNGVRAALRGQSYELLCYLHEHADRLCTRREIVEQVFRQQYDEKEPSQRSLLNTAIRRLREKIEDDPDQPRYLLTEPGGGYRLVAQPKK
jgi:DNA-binding response OmpR family regulator